MLNETSKRKTAEAELGELKKRMADLREEKEREERQGSDMKLRLDEGEMKVVDQHLMFSHSCPSR